MSHFSKLPTYSPLFSSRMSTSYSLLADDVWRCILPYLTLSAIHHLTHLDSHLHRTFARDPFPVLVLTDCCRLPPAQLDTALKSGRSAVYVMRRVLSGAVGVESMLGRGSGLGKLHQAMLLHSLQCAMQYADEMSHSRTASSSSCSPASSSISSDSHSRVRSLSSCSEPPAPSEWSHVYFLAAATIASTSPPTPDSSTRQLHDQSSLISTPPSTTSTLSTTSSSSSSSTTCCTSSHLSLLYFYTPPDYSLPSPLRILSAATSPAAHFPFPHPYFALWLSSRWEDKQWVAEWVAARRRAEDNEEARQARRKEMEEQYSSDIAVNSKLERAAVEEKNQPADNHHDKADWTLDRHERVATATVSDLSRHVRWLGEYASPSHPHGEVFGYLISPITKRQGRARHHSRRDYEYAYIDDDSGSQQGSDTYQPPSGSGWDRMPVVSWRVVSAPSRMRFALTVWPCLYVYMKSLAAPGLIDGWARRVGVERPVLSECSIRGRMFLHMAAMDRWEAIQ